MKRPLLVSVLGGSLILSLACGGIEAPPAAPAPSSTPTATATPAPSTGGTATAARQRYTPRLEAHCAHIERCGCEPKATCLDGMAMYDGAIPDGILDCMDGLSCDGMCDQSVLESCVMPYAEQLQANMRTKTTGGYCGQLAACGCPKAGCEAAFADVQPETVEFMGCAQRLSCPDLCPGEASALVPGVVAYDACLAPILARMETVHRTNMRIIRSMGGTGTRVVDQYGNTVDEY